MSEEFNFSCEHAAHRKSTPSVVSHYEQLEGRHRSSPVSLKTLACNELLCLYSIKGRGFNIFMPYCFFNIHSSFKFKPDLPLAGHSTSGDTFANVVTSTLSQKMNVVVDTFSWKYLCQYLYSRDKDGECDRQPQEGGDRSPLTAGFRSGWWGTGPYFKQTSSVWEEKPISFLETDFAFKLLQN